LDPCSSERNHKAPRFYTEADDGLSLPWDGRVFVNPPFGLALPHWVAKAAREAWENPACEHVIMLIPARPDTRYYHRWIMRAAMICHVEGRLTFGYSDTGANAPFPSQVVVFKGAPSEIPRLVAMDRGGRMGRHRLECAACGEPFRATRRDARACSGRCRVRLSRAK